MLNKTLLCLTLKVKGAAIVTQYRHMVFKIIHRILANRVGLIVNRIISSQRAAFLKDRRIFYCIALVSKGSILWAKRFLTVTCT